MPKVHWQNSDGCVLLEFAMELSVVEVSKLLLNTSYKRKTNKEKPVTGY
jgi:hypothetical protein